MFKDTKYILLFIFCLLNFVSKAQQKKIVGYLPEYRFKVSDKIDYCKLTHLNICFANPDSKGNILLSDTLADVLTSIRAKNPDLKIFISLAGGALLKDQAITWKRLIDNPKNRPAFIEKIVSYVEEYNFDGVDVDLEWKNVTKGYSPFILELNEVLEVKNIELTAALPGIYRYSNITDEAIHTFDFINLMAYDERGSWAPHKPGQHSSIPFAQRSIHFWRDSVGIPPEKLTLGLPLYAYNFTNPKKTISHTIAEVISFNHQNAFVDSFGLIYFNGKPTLEAKVRLASEDLAGVMVWELGQDTTGEFAMINTIHNQFKVLQLKTTDDYCGLNKEEIYAIENEAFKDKVKIWAIKKKFAIEYDDIDNLIVQVTNSKKKTHKLKIQKEGNKNIYKVKKLKKGVYTISISDDTFKFEKKLSLK